MKGFSNKRNNRHGNKQKSTYILQLEHRCRCAKHKNESDNNKRKFADCMAELSKNNI